MNKTVVRDSLDSEIYLEGFSILDCVEAAILEWDDARVITGRFDTSGVFSGCRSLRTSPSAEWTLKEEEGSVTCFLKGAGKIFTLEKVDQIC